MQEPPSTPGAPAAGTAVLRQLCRQGCDPPSAEPEAGAAPLPLPCAGTGIQTLWTQAGQGAGHRTAALASSPLLETQSKALAIPEKALPSPCQGALGQRRVPVC